MLAEHNGGAKAGLRLELLEERMPSLLPCKPAAAREALLAARTRTLTLALTLALALALALALTRSCWPR